jgi:hypothetical protein
LNDKRAKFDVENTREMFRARLYERSSLAIDRDLLSRKEHVYDANLSVILTSRKLLTEMLL